MTTDAASKQDSRASPLDGWNVWKNGWNESGIRTRENTVVSWRWQKRGWMDCICTASVLQHLCCGAVRLAAHAGMQHAKNRLREIALPSSVKVKLLFSFLRANDSTTPNKLSTFLTFSTAVDVEGTGKVRRSELKLKKVCAIPPACVCRSPPAFCSLLAPGSICAFASCILCEATALTGSLGVKER